LCIFPGQIASILFLCFFCFLNFLFLFVFLIPPQVKTSARFGVLLPEGEVRVDFPAVMARMRQLRGAIAPHDGVDR
jgi:hypothetical protein